ncbi:hypothetical protein BDV29DRAFT_181039 [Aspergillus leporis]|uniref:Uncharacterized protein n=1 Tax=Aspergillus leporis TaxID=41062 RepID=A0A5N5WP81_9EURO|nr:hypothetical protein BDV29DRAFT_181039 [Aspergillus leporis]
MVIRSPISTSFDQLPPWFTYIYSLQSYPNLRHFLPCCSQLISHVFFHSRFFFYFFFISTLPFGFSFVLLSVQSGI